MGESTKTVAALVLMVASIAAAVAWVEERPGATVWALRIGGPIVALFAIGLILVLHSRADLAPDYLRQRAGNYFNRDGFCFAFTASAVDGVAYMIAYYQTQYDRPCVGRIAFRPARGFFMQGAAVEAITYEIHCAPVAFGLARVAIPVPQDLQGKRQSFEVGAAVEYPEGKGQRLRFYDGIFLRANTNFEDRFGKTLAVAGAATGPLVLSLVPSDPVTATVVLPVNVTDEVPASTTTEVKTLWKLGDPPLENAA